MSSNRSRTVAKGVIAIAVLLVVTGAAGAAWRFVEQWWPLFALGGVAVLAGLVVLFRRQRARSRAAAARQLHLDTQVATTDAMTGPRFEEMVEGNQPPEPAPVTP
jgi:membrane protein YdbS with pleckstrin-like domain